MNLASASLNDALDAFTAAALSQIHTCLPGRVEDFDFTTRKASIKPLIKRPYLDSAPKALPVIPGVPVVFPWGGGASLTFPVVKGDMGVLLFTERAMETWLAKGGDAEPGAARMFSLNDGIFIPGLAPFNVGGPAEDGESLLLKYQGAKIRMHGGKLAIGNTGGELLDLFTQLLTALETAQCAAPGSPLSTVALFTTIKNQLALLKGTL